MPKAKKRAVKKTAASSKVLETKIKKLEKENDALKKQFKKDTEKLKKEYFTKGIMASHKEYEKIIDKVLKSAGRDLLKEASAKLKKSATPTASPKKPAAKKEKTPIKKTAKKQAAKKSAPKKRSRPVKKKAVEK